MNQPVTLVVRWEIEYDTYLDTKDTDAVVRACTEAAHWAYKMLLDPANEARHFEVQVVPGSIQTARDLTKSIEVNLNLPD